MARVWVDFTNTAHVVVLRPLVERLVDAGHEVALTARPLSHTVQLLDDWGRPYAVFGEHGGVSRAGKARAMAGRARQMVGFGRAHGPFDASFAHGSTDLPVASRALGIPTTTMLDYEFAIAQHTVNGLLCNRALVPESIPPERLRRFGMVGAKLVRYPGLKEEYILHGFAPDPAVLDEVGVDPSRPLAVVRTAPSYALYLGGSETPLLPRLLRRLSEIEVQTVVLPRNAEQGDGVRALGLPGVIVPPRAVEARSLVAYADALFSAGGSMNREAAALGTPVWSMFEGRLGGVDEQLVREGRLQLMAADADVSQLEVAKQPGVSRPALTRDPADLLRLAVGGWVEPLP
jgi:predicted glycosyltransferase